MKYAWLGKRVDEHGFVVQESGQGTARRPLNVDGTKDKSAPYQPYAYTLRFIHQANRHWISRQPKMKPRLSRKGKPLSGILPRLCGY